MYIGIFTFFIDVIRFIVKMRMKEHDIFKQLRPIHIVQHITECVIHLLMLRLSSCERCEAGHCGVGL